jgi:hypothetical protein
VLEMVKFRKEKVSRNKSMNLQKSDPVELMEGGKKSKDDTFGDNQYW